MPKQISKKWTGNKLGFQKSYEADYTGTFLWTTLNVNMCKKFLIKQITLKSRVVDCLG